MSHRKKRNLLHDDSEKVLQISDTTTAMVNCHCGLLFPPALDAIFTHIQALALK